jgi:xylulose-5-phosphate/fructose-6-phosphate phosphoketolase
MDVIDRVRSLGGWVSGVRQELADARLQARAYAREHGQDPPEDLRMTWPYWSLVRALVVNTGPAR